MSRWMGSVALLVAVVAVALAAWALMGRTAPTSPTVAPVAGDSKTRVCTAFDTVTKAVSLQSHTDLGPDDIAKTAVAGNARLALLGGGQYLLNSLDSATPANLADEVRSFADDLQDIGMNALAGAPNSDPDQAARLDRGDHARQQITDLCK